MSASREKKQRQGSDALTQRQIKQQQEAQAAKKKRTVYWCVGIVCALAVAALLIWDAGLIQRNMTAATVGGEKVSVAQMQFYYNYTRTNELNTQQQYAGYGIDLHSWGLLEENAVQYDATSSLGDEQVYNTSTGETYAQHFKDAALEAMQQIVSLNQAADAAGYTLSEASQTGLKESIASTTETLKANGWSSLGAYLKAQYGNFVTPKIYKEFLERSTLASDYQAHYQNGLTYDDDALLDYAEENPANLYTYDWRVAFVDGSVPSTTNDAGETVEASDEEKAAAKEEAKARADVMVTGIKSASGDKSAAFDRLLPDAVEEGSSYLEADQNTYTGVLGSNVSSLANGYGYFSWLSDAEREVGDVEAVESGNGYYVVLLTGRYLNNDPTVTVRHILINAELPTDDPDTEENEAAAPTQEAMDAAKAEAQRILDEYNGGEKTAEAFGALAEKYSEDTGSARNGGLIRYIVSADNYVQSFEDWALDASRKAGDVGLVENNVEGNSYFGYHVMYFEGEDGPKWHSLAENALRSNDTTAWADGLVEACSVTEESGMAYAVK